MKQMLSRVWIDFNKTKTTIIIDDLQSANFELSVSPNQTWPVLHCFDESLKELCLRSLLISDKSSLKRRNLLNQPVELGEKN